MDIRFIKINVPVNASEGGQYSSGVISRAEVKRTVPNLMFANPAWKSEDDFLSGALKIKLKDVPEIFQVTYDSEFVAEISCLTVQDYAWGGIPIAQKVIEQTVGEGNTEIITVTIPD